MRILVTGRGGAASWTIRGEQIGMALGAVVKPRATLADIKAADAVLVVKRVPDDLLDSLRRSKRPWAYDVVDAYPQPMCSRWTRQQAAAWMRDYLRRLSPTGVIWPTEKMRDDCGEGPVIYHHHRSNLAKNPVRPKIAAIGYEGRPHYLDGWRKVIDRECQARGIDFLLNPSRLADVDIVLAVRGGEWRGYVQDHWKSNVKLANAHASGTPFIGIRERGYTETGTGAEEWVDHPNDLGRALDHLSEQTVRAKVQREFLQAAIPIERTAAQFREALCGLKS